jgi:hypothetical protein
MLGTKYKSLIRDSNFDSLGLESLKSWTGLKININYHPKCYLKYIFYLSIIYIKKKVLYWSKTKIDQNKILSAKH